MIVNYHNEQKNRWKITKAKRIAQVSFQAEIDASNESQQQGVNQEKFKHNN